MSRSNNPNYESEKNATQQLALYQLKCQVKAKDLDAYEHVNNVTYIQWCENIAWLHSKHNGLDIEQFRQNDCALVVRKHQFEYVASAYLGDDIRIETWITKSDNKFSFWRKYRMYNQHNVLLFRGKTHWVSVSMTTGKVRRMPEHYATAYPVTEEQEI